MKDDIMQIATALRVVAEVYIGQHKCLERSCRGFCIAVSLALQAVLEKNGYRSRVIRGRFEGRGHAWVETQDKIVDITLDQFGDYPRVCVVGISDTRYSEVTDDEEFEAQMGIAGDNVQWTYIDNQGEETPLGTTNSVVRDLVVM